MLTLWPRTLLGGAVGLIGLIAMIRLVGGGFPGRAGFAMIFVGLAMVPWVLYVAARARNGRLTAGAGLVVAGLALIGLVAVWFATLGPVLALAMSLVAFAIVWVQNLPRRRRQADRLVRIEEFAESED